MKKFFSLIAAVLFAGSMFAAEVTVSKTVEELATANSWANGTVVTPFALDEVITVSTDATDANTGKYYTSGQQVRLYQTGAAKLIISAAEGYSISSITLTYASQNNGILLEAESGVAVDLDNVELATFTVGNSGEATNGQARITAISVTYNGEGGEVPPTPQPTVNYYVAGTMNGWAADSAYMLTPNNESLYQGEFTFAANDEFKVIGFDGTNTTWFPGGMGNNFQITEAGDYKITFNPAGNVDGWYEGFFNVVMKEAPIVHQYEVAEAIAAGLQENDEVLVRGIITKMEFKGKNFAKYGSVNIYVADATGAEGEFEFYNCYSLNADTFRTSNPAYDATSTAWAEFEEVADANGNAIHVGDTVIAFGKYKLYNTTHELNTGCYLVDIKHQEEAPVSDEWDVIFWEDAIAADDLASDARFGNSGSEFVVAITDPDNKMSVDANGAWFGNEEEYRKFTHRLKSGGKSSSTKNFITLEIPEDGTLRIAVRTGSNSATDRNLIVLQDADTLFNEIILETSVINVQVDDTTSLKVYPYVEVPVKAGQVVLSYPVNGLNFYAFAFKAEEPEPEPIVLDVQYAEALYSASNGFWQINLYKDYDSESQTVTYPDFYIGVVPKSATAIAGTYSLDNNEIYFIEVDFEGVQIYATEATDFVVTYLSEGVYRYELEFVGDDGNTYILDVALETFAYDYDNDYAEIELTDGGVPEAISNTNVVVKSVKMIKNGHLFIMKGDKTYNVLGIEVR